MKRHIAIKHKGVNLYDCSDCSVAFLLETNLSGHMASIHEGKKPFKCNNCDASFTTKQFQEKNKENRILTMSKESNKTEFDNNKKCRKISHV